jgi:hypothetical protein
MQAAENAAWQDFRRLNAGLWTTLYYNVHVGTVPGDDDTEHPADRMLRASLYAKRVDVIARTSRETWVIEVKAAARASAIGQVLVYPPLVLTRCPEWAPLRPMLVAASCDPDVAATAVTYGVEVFCPPFTLVAPRLR